MALMAPYGPLRPLKAFVNGIAITMRRHLTLRSYCFHQAPRLLLKALVGLVCKTLPYKAFKGL